MSEFIISIADVTKSYQGRLALQRVTMQVPTGITGLLGPNGSGKSTLIKALLGLVTIEGGRGRVLDFDWPDQTRALRDRVGYLPEDDCFIQGLQGIESIQMMARLSGLYAKEALRRSHEVADFCDLGQERYRHVETYSTGMRQKLKFAQALVHDPDLIILDEPTTGLDPEQRENFLERISILAKEKRKSILLSTHILHDVQRVCDHVIILANGRVRLASSLIELQRPAEAGLSIGVVSDAAKLCQQLQSQGLDCQLVNDQQLLLRSDDMTSGRIWQASLQADVLIQRIEPARNSLEQLFLDAVREDQAACPS